MHTQQVRAARHARKRGCARRGGARACACSPTRPCAHMRTCTCTCAQAHVHAARARSAPRSPAQACTAEAARERAPDDLHAHVHVYVRVHVRVHWHTTRSMREGHATPVRAVVPDARSAAVLPPSARSSHLFIVYPYYTSTVCKDMEPCTGPNLSRQEEGGRWQEEGCTSSYARFRSSSSKTLKLKKSCPEDSGRGELA